MKPCNPSWKSGKSKNFEISFKNCFEKLHFPGLKFLQKTFRIALKTLSVYWEGWVDGFRCLECILRTLTSHSKTKSWTHVIHKNLHWKLVRSRKFEKTFKIFFLKPHFPATKFLQEHVVSLFKYHQHVKEDVKMLLHTSYVFRTSVDAHIVILRKIPQFGHIGQLFVHFSKVNGPTLESHKIG